MALGLDSILQSLFGEGFKDMGIMDMLGSEGMKNIITGGTALMNGMQTGDMLDFQKGLATKADARTDKLFAQDQEDKEALNNLDFG